MSKFNQGISLVIPAYNEESIIGSTLDICIKHLKEITEDYEILIVDDGSTDSTGQILEYYSNKNRKIKVIHNAVNQGSGRSLFKGFKKAEKEIIVSNFADLPFDMAELGNLLTLLEDTKADFVVVTRKDRSANSFFRKVTSLANYWLIRTLFNVKVRDFQFVQLYSKRVIENMEVISYGTFVAPEMIIRSLGFGYKMKEYVCSFYPRLSGVSKCGNIRVITQTIREIFSFWFAYCISSKMRAAKSQG